MIKLNNKPNKELFHDTVFFTMEGDKINLWHSNNGFSYKYYCSAKDNPNDNYEIDEWWSISRKEFLNPEETFISIMRYFGKFYSYRSSEVLLNLKKI